MGRLRYDQEDFETDDRILAHLQVVIAQKARRHENFLLTLNYLRAGAEVTSSLWMSASSSVHFAYTGSRHAQLNQRWLEQMMAATHSTLGLNMSHVPEPTG